MTLYIRAFALAAALLAPAVSHAHHAFSAEFDANLPIRVSGTVTRMEWINPHAWVHVRAEPEDGAARDWMLEAGLGDDATRSNVVSALSRYERQGKIFSRPKPSTFGLLSFAEGSENTKGSPEASQEGPSPQWEATNVEVHQSPC